MARLAAVEKGEYYPYLNRFISPDTIVPDSANPQSLNRYSYVENNPVLYADPSGHTKWEPPTPLSLPYDVTAFELGWLWFTEQCPEHVLLDGNYDLTKSLMHDEGVNQAREQFYRKLEEGRLIDGTDDAYGYRYVVIPYAREAVQYALGEDRVGFFLGSYTVHTHLNADEGTVTFTITDPKGWESGTRSPFFYGPDFVGRIVNPALPESMQLHRSQHSIEGLIMGQEQFSFPSDVFLASVLGDRSRSDPGLFGSDDLRYGGHIDITFTWTEPLQVDQEE